MSVKNKNMLPVAEYQYLDPILILSGKMGIKIYPLYLLPKGQKLTKTKVNGFVAKVKNESPVLVRLVRGEISGLE